MDPRAARAAAAVETAALDFAELAAAIERSRVGMLRFEAALELAGLDEVERLDGIA